MEDNRVRLKAYAINFNEIRVLLSTGYYNGMSSKFYLKDMQRDDLILLSGDALERSHNSEYQEYILHTTFEVGKVYRIFDEYGLSCTLDFTRLSLCDEFDDKFYYGKDDLGSHYTKNKTVFKVWAPLATEVILKVIHNGKTELYSMIREDKGVHSYTLKGDYEGAQYFYLVRHVESYLVTLDPYAYASSANGRSSIVVDLSKVRPHKYELPRLKQKTDAIIYEASVRDFSSLKESGMKNKGLFLAFTEENTKSPQGLSTGLDYLTELGITHLQLMPINDFATVDEGETDVLYNWGYDPAQYNITEGSYVSDPNSGYKRIQEAQEMISALHKRGIRVVLDVVYNHMHDVNINTLERTVPHYFFRRNSEGYLSNGSWCGNDLNTTAKMCRKYVLDMCRRWQVLYGVDGYRFDLMGIIDIETMKLIEEQATKIDSSFIVYGEGWNMATDIPEEERTIIHNNRKVRHIGFFNDFFRDTLRGSNQMETKGYLSGDTYKTYEALKAMCNTEMFDNISQSINYLECHDNATCFDKLKVSNYDEDETIRKRRAQLMLASVLLSQGVPFIHSGQEFFRTKKGHQNTYNAGDLINALDWNRRDQEKESVDFVKFLIELRKDNPCFRYSNYDMIQERVFMENVAHRMIKYSLIQDKGEYESIIVYINPSLDNIDVQVEEGFKCLYHTDDYSIENGHLTITGVTLAILVR